MQTIVLQEPGRFILTETAPPPQPGPGEALVRIRRIGVCGTDLHAFRGRQPFFSYPRILGHELGVEVEALGSETDRVQVGDRCAVEPYLNCGTCIACRRGKSNCCASLQVLGVHCDGGMRERILVPIEKLYPSTTLTLEQLALVETLGIGAHATARANPAADEAVLVTGAGPIGLSVLPFLKAAGVRKIFVRDTNAARLAFCREAFGIEETLLAGDPETTEQTLRERNGGDLPTVVFDATGNKDSMHESFRYVAPGGKLIFVGLFMGEITFNDPDFHRRELTILATRNSTPEDFRRVMDAVESKVVDTTPWVTHQIPSAELPHTFPTLLEPGSGVLKAVVLFE